MAKFSFQPKAFGITADKADTDMGCPTRNAAFEAQVVFLPGIEALIEGFRLANIKGFPTKSGHKSAGDVDR